MRTSPSSASTCARVQSTQTVSRLAAGPMLRSHASHRLHAEQSCPCEQRAHLELQQRRVSVAWHHQLLRALSRRAAWQHQRLPLLLLAAATGLALSAAALLPFLPIAAARLLPLVSMLLFSSSGVLQGAIVVIAARQLGITTRNIVIILIQRHGAVCALGGLGVAGTPQV